MKKKTRSLQQVHSTVIHSSPMLIYLFPIPTPFVSRPMRIHIVIVTEPNGSNLLTPAQLSPSLVSAYIWVYRLSCVFTSVTHHLSFFPRASYHLFCIFSSLAPSSRTFQVRPIHSISSHACNYHLLSIFPHASYPFCIFSRCDPSWQLPIMYISSIPISAATHHIASSSHVSSIPYLLISPPHRLRIYLSHHILRQAQFVPYLSCPVCAPVSHLIVIFPPTSPHLFSNPTFHHLNGHYPHYSETRIFIHLQIKYFHFPLK